MPSLAERMAKYKLLWIAILGLTSFLYLAVSVSKIRYFRLGGTYGGADANELYYMGIMLKNI
jgi:hypothetical protein